MRGDKMGGATTAEISAGRAVHEGCGSAEEALSNAAKQKSREDFLARLAMAESY